MTGPDPGDEAWEKALEQARFWLQTLGERDYGGQTIGEFSAWIDAAPYNEAAFRHACAESLMGLMTNRTSAH